MKYALRWIAHLFSGAMCLFMAQLAGAASLTEGVALVTAVEGKVRYPTSSGNETLGAFIKLKQGDMLSLEGGARVRIVYFASKRQESWAGTGKLEITPTDGKGQGLGEPEVKLLPELLVRQIARTPSVDDQGRVGMIRVRAIATPQAVAKLEKDYQQLRADSAHDDLNPEIFLLAGLLELRQLDQLEKTIGQLPAMHPGNLEAKVLASIYGKALKNLQESGK